MSEVHHAIHDRGVLAENLESPLPWWQSSQLTCCTAGSSHFSKMLVSPGAKGMSQTWPHQPTPKTAVPWSGGWIFSCRKQSGEDRNIMQESIANCNLSSFSFSWFFHIMSRQYFSVHTPLPSCDWVWNVPDKSPCTGILLSFHTDMTFPTL